jgi:hypothetical protein
MTKTIVGIAALVGIGLCAANAEAAGKVRVGVVALRGAGEGPVRAKISAALKANGFQVVATQQLESSASGLGVSLDGDAGFRAVAKELNIAAFVVGEMTKKRAELTVRNGADGAVLGAAAFAGPNPKKIAGVVGADFWRQLGSVVKQGRPPSGAKAKAVIAEEAPAADEEAAAPEPPPPPPEKKKKGSKKAAEPAPEAEPEASESGKPVKEAKAEPAAEEEETSTGGPAPLALEFGVGGRALFRRLDWNQNVQNQVAPYALSPGPEAGVWLEAFPGALTTTGLAANVGVFGNFNYGFGVTSTTTGANPSKLTTKFQDFMGGLKVRLPIKSLAPYLSLAYGAQSFSLASTTTTSPLPSVAYKFFRVGLGTRVNLGAQASVDFGVAYMFVTDPGSKAGEIKSAAFFPRATASAIDVGASFGFRFTKLLGARAGVDFRQYGLDFKVQQADPMIVGGATDRYITAWGGIEVVLDGIGGGSSDDDDEAEPEAPAPPPKTKGRKKKAAPPPDADDDDADAEK